MRVLLDSHTLIWAMDQPTKLSTIARNTIEDIQNELFVGAGNLWEISIKIGLGKLVLSQPFPPWCRQALQILDWAILPIEIDHAALQSTLPHHHGDPFDRMLVAQALTENMSVVSADKILEAYGIQRIW